MYWMQEIFKNFIQLQNKKELLKKNMNMHKKLGINFRDYQNLYLKADVLIFADASL